MDLLERWATACGYRMEFIGPEHDALVREVQSLPLGELDLARALLRLLPRLDPADRRTLQLLVDGWYQSYGARAADSADLVEGAGSQHAASGRRGA